MLSIEKINFPITFKNCANGKNITYHREHGNGVWSDGWKSSLSLKYFINLHNEHNQSNSNVLRYYYEMAEKREDNDLADALNYLNIKPGQVFVNGAVFTASIIAKDYDYICDVELMPVGAILVGIQRECWEWDELKFKPRRIEVHDDTITLLSGYAGGYKTGNNYSGEINIKRGTKVKIKNSTNC